MIGCTEPFKAVSSDPATGPVGICRVHTEKAVSKIGVPNTPCLATLPKRNGTPIAHDVTVAMTNTAETSRSTRDRPRAYAYVYTSRIRSPEVAQQVLVGRRLAESEGYIVVKTEIDGGRNSSSLFERDGLRRLLAAAGKRKFDVLILQDKSCLPHNPMDLFAVLTQLCIHGVEIHSVSEGLVDTQALVRVAAESIFDGREKIANGAERPDWDNQDE